MTNQKLQSILSNYPDDCEVIFIVNSDSAEISQICVEYDEDSNFEKPELVLYLRL